MTEQVQIALIAGGFTALGAVLGFLGSLLAARQVTKTARKQVGYDLIHTRKDEALSEIYAKLLDFKDDLPKLVRSSSDRETRIDEVRAAKDKLTEWKVYFRKQWLWIHVDVAEKLATVYVKYLDLLGEVLEALEDRSTTRYEEVFKEMDRELNSSKSREEETDLLLAIRESLGVYELE